MEEQPQDPRQSSANFLNVLGVALSGLAIIAVLISLFMTQMSLNDISLALNDIEEKLEVAEEDIELIQEEDVMDEGLTEEDESMIGAGAQVYYVGQQQVDFLDYTVWVPEDWEVEEMFNVQDPSVVEFSRDDELVMTLQCPKTEPVLEGWGLDTDEAREIVSAGSTDIIARFSNYFETLDDYQSDFYMIRLIEVPEGQDYKEQSSFCIFQTPAFKNTDDEKTFYGIFKSIFYRLDSTKP